MFRDHDCSRVNEPMKTLGSNCELERATMSLSEWINNKNLLSHGSGGQKSEIKILESWSLLRVLKNNLSLAVLVLYRCVSSPYVFIFSSLYVFMSNLLFI